MIRTRMIMTIIFITTKTLWPVAPVMWFRFRSGDGAVPTEADNEDGDDDEGSVDNGDDDDEKGSVVEEEESCF